MSATHQNKRILQIKYENVKQEDVCILQKLNSAELKLMAQQTNELHLKIQIDKLYKQIIDQFRSQNGAHEEVIAVLNKRIHPHRILRKLPMIYCEEPKIDDEIKLLFKNGYEHIQNQTTVTQKQMLVKYEKILDLFKKYLISAQANILKHESTIQILKLQLRDIQAKFYIFEFLLDKEHIQDIQEDHVAEIYQMDMGMSMMQKEHHDLYGNYQDILECTRGFNRDIGEEIEWEKFIDLIYQCPEDKADLY